MTTAALFGSTGFVGSYILTTLLASNAFASVYTISRRPPKEENAKLQAVVDGETAQWPAKLSAIQPVPGVVFSAVGTTRAAAGGIDAQWKIDHDLNVEVARAAKQAGAATFVFVSSAGTRGLFSGSVPYSRMKVGVEDTVKELGFEQAIILRPGLIMGEREVAHTGGPLMNSLVRGLGRISQGLQDAFGQEGQEIARAAVHAVRLAGEGKAPSKYWVLEQSDIVRLGRTEWKE